MGGKGRSWEPAEPPGASSLYPAFPEHRQLVAGVCVCWWGAGWCTAMQPASFVTQGTPSPAVAGSWFFTQAVLSLRALSPAWVHPGGPQPLGGRGAAFPRCRPPQPASTHSAVWSAPMLCIIRMRILAPKQDRGPPSPAQPGVWGWRGALPRAEASVCAATGPHLWFAVPKPVST